MWNQVDLAVAAAASVDPGVLGARFQDLMGRICGRFGRVEPRRHAEDLVRGLASEVPTKNCWTIAEHVGHATPEGLQHLLRRAVWDHDGVRDDLRDYVVENLGVADAVLVVDETGDLKKGTRTVGVQRQYTGTAGRIENSQVAVYLTYATSRGHALIDRALYLPKSWVADTERRAAAGVPDEVEFATKPMLAREMILAALDGGAAASWVAGDEVYGADPRLRNALEDRGVGYVLAVACSHPVMTAAGKLRADAIAGSLPRCAWQRLSAGAGSKGQRFYDWAWITIDTAKPGQRWLLIRRNTSTGELAFYRCYAPNPVPLSELVRVAGRRWTVEESFQAGKGLTGLDQHQVRRWVSWHRWTVLAMLAHAYLAVLAATERDRHPAPDGLIPLTCNEIHHLFNVLLAHPISNAWHRLRGHSGADNTSTAPKPATSDEQKPNHEHLDLPLSYYAGACAMNVQRPAPATHVLASRFRGDAAVGRVDEEERCSEPRQFGLLRPEFREFEEHLCGVSLLLRTRRCA